jgi:FKBP-type peptidyl-prolyl cis-trans isomerase 2
MKVTPTSFVTIDFLIRTDEIELQTGQPEELSFCLGWGLMPKALEEAMVGMSLHEHRVVRLTPQQAFGEVDEDLILELDRQDFDPGLTPEPGDVFETTDEEGHPVYFVVKALESDTVVVDFNHPLAGKEVEFLVTLKGVREATPEDAEGCTCSHCGGTHSHEH